MPVKNINIAYKTDFKDFQSFLCSDFVTGFKKSKMVVVHMVWIKTKEDVGTEKVNAIVAGVDELKHIPGVVSVEAGKVQRCLH